MRLKNIRSFCKTTFLNKLFVFPFSVLIAAGAEADYAKHPLAEKFVNKMVSEHQFEREEVISLLSKAKKQQSILDAISRPAEKTKEWFEYRKIFVQESRINQGVEFWQQHTDAITRASQTYGVAPEVIVAIIGVETRYGRHAGKYKVLDALATLGFDYPKRGKFFRSELEHFMLLAKEQKQDPLTLKGSYAGAMGYGQFIPSSFRNFAVDFDGDEIVDIWNNPTDAIGSVANYFKAHKWQSEQPVFSRARIKNDYDSSVLNSRKRPNHTLKELGQKGFVPVEQGLGEDKKAVPLMFTGDHGKEFWIGFDNFYVITRYNRSHMYALAVWQLSQEIKQRLPDNSKKSSTPLAASKS